MDVIKFTKMHGIGNDYIYIDCLKNCPDKISDLSVEMSPRHTGVGSDGIILILPSKIADFRMRIFNADGSEAKMCGNGSRCVGKYVYDHQLTDKTNLTLETLSGVKYLNLHINDTLNKVDRVTVDMGKFSLISDEIPVKSSLPTMIDSAIETSIGSLRLTAVSMGNPHGVIFVDALNAIGDISLIGSELEHHQMWPDRANIEFAHVIDKENIEMRVWERGSGETMACGTGACAVAVAAITTGRTNNSVNISLPGGTLSVSVNPDNGHVLMTGPAVEVFTGSYTRKRI